MSKNTRVIEKTGNITNNEGKEEALKHVPSSIHDDKRVDFIINADRTHLDFSKEIDSLLKHELTFTRPRLEFLLNNVYIPKFKVKSFSSYIYGGETPQNYN